MVSNLDVQLAVDDGESNAGPGTGQMLSTYIVEIGQPIASFTH